MEKSIEKAAVDYQEIARQIKKLEAKLKPLKATLVDYAKSNKKDFDEAFQLKFTNGVYISHRVKDCIDGSKDAKQELLEYDKSFIKKDLNEKAVLMEYSRDNRLKKIFTKLGLKVSQKESFAVYAG